MNHDHGYEGIEKLAYEAARLAAYELEGKRVRITFSHYTVEQGGRVWYAPWRRKLEVRELEIEHEGVLTLDDHTDTMRSEIGCNEEEWIAAYIDGSWVHYLDPTTEIEEIP